MPFGVPGPEERARLSRSPDPGSRGSVPLQKGAPMPSRTESEVMDVLVRDLAEQFDVKVVDVRAIDLGLTALLTVRSFGPGGFPTFVAAGTVGGKSSGSDWPLTGPSNGSSPRGSR
jgi:hypothetical protein